MLFKQIFFWTKGSDPSQMHMLLQITFKKNSKNGTLNVFIVDLAFTRNRFTCTYYYHSLNYVNFYQ